MNGKENLAVSHKSDRQHFCSRIIHPATYNNTVSYKTDNVLLYRNNDVQNVRI